ncbi:hypothetical protein FKM82_030032 [Ascaphus truei]
MDSALIEDLRNEVSLRDPLWNQRSRTYHDRNVHDKLWKEIAQLLNTSRKYFPPFYAYMCVFAFPAKGISIRLYTYIFRSGMRIRVYLPFLPKAYPYACIHVFSPQVCVYMCICLSRQKHTHTPVYMS